MPAGLGKGATANEHSRPGNQALTYRLSETGVRPSRIPHRRKPLIQGLPDDSERPDNEHGGMVQPLLFHNVGVDRTGMDMGIDKTREQGLFSAIDGQGFRRDSPG
jgi:hypothetical protein